MPGTNLGTAFVQIVPSAQGISGAIRGVLNGEASSAGDSAGKTIASKLKGAIAAAGIGVAVTAGLKKALDETGALQQSYIGGLDTLYGDAADKAREYAKEAAKAGISQNTFAEQAVSFGAALKQAYGGDTNKAMEAANTAILDMTDNAAKMGTPIESVQDAYQGFAKGQYMLLDNLKLGYGGTKTEMERLLSDAEKISGVEYNIDNLGDVYDAIHVVQGELGLTGVAAAEASETLTGSFGAMKAAFDNLMGNLGLGENVAESMQAFSEAVSTYLFGNLIPTLGTIMQQIPVAISTFIQTGLPQFMAAGTQLVQTLAAGVSNGFPQMIRTFMTGLVKMSGQLRANFAKFVDLGLGLIKSIANGIIKNIPTFIQTVPKIVTNIAGLINDNAPKLIATGLSIIKSLALGLIKAIPVLVKNIPQILQAIWSVFMAFQWANLGKLAVSGIATGIKALKGTAKKAADKVKDSVVNAIKAIPGKISSAISNIKSKLSFSGLAAKVKGVFDKIKEKITEPITKAKEKVKEAVDKIKDMFPFNVGQIFKGKIKLPKISVKKKEDGGATTSSSTSTTNFAKAMDTPYMFNRETVFAAGEAGDEILYGRSSLMNDITAAMQKGGGSGDIIINLNYDATDDATDMLRDVARGVRRYRMAGAF